MADAGASPAGIVGAQADVSSPLERRAGPGVGMEKDTAAAARGDAAAISDGRQLATANPKDFLVPELRLYKLP